MYSEIKEVEEMEKKYQIGEDCKTNEMIKFFEKMDRIDTENIMILPQRANLEILEFMYAEETTDFVKYSRSEEQKILTVKVDETIKIIGLHSSTLWLPVIFIAEKILLPIAIKLLCGYINKKIGNCSKSEQEVHLEMTTKDEKGIYKTFNYTGDAESLENILNKVDVSKFFSDLQ